MHRTPGRPLFSPSKNLTFLADTPVIHRFGPQFGKGVDLYGGTRRSSAIALRKLRTPEEIKRATMHSTNKAFERYFRIESEDLRDIYRDTREKKTGGVGLMKGNGKG